MQKLAAGMYLQRVFAYSKIMLGSYSKIIKKTLKFLVIFRDTTVRAI